MDLVARHVAALNSTEIVTVEPATFEEFFAAEKDRLLRVLAFATGSNAEAEDLAQDAFTTVLEHWDRVRTMDDPAGYLHRTAINLFRNKFRRGVIAVRRGMGAAPPRDVFGDIEDRDSLTRAMASLTSKQRAALVLTEVMGYSGEETGRLLGVKASTVWVLTHRARTVLKDAMEESDV
jgi:RNA polymerase sigma-70 factor (ECF subfamily)